MQAIEFQHNTPLQVADIIRVFNASGITRPTHDAARIEKMFAHANLIGEQVTYFRVGKDAAQVVYHLAKFATGVPAH